MCKKFKKELNEERENPNTEENIINENEKIFLEYENNKNFIEQSVYEINYFFAFNIIILQYLMILYMLYLYKKVKIIFFFAFILSYLILNLLLGVVLFVKYHKM